MRIGSLLDVSRIYLCHWIFNMKSFQWRHPFGTHWAKNQISRASNLSTDRRFVLVWVGLARAVGWKTMAIRWSVRGSGGLIFGSMCANVVSNIALFYPTPLLEIFSFFLICYYTIKTIDDWDWGISNDCWKLVWSYQFQSLLHLIV